MKELKKNLQSVFESQLPKKTSLKLSKDQIRFLEEVPERASEFISTFNHIGQSISTYYDELRFIINKFIKQQKHWKVDEDKTYDFLIIPFAYTPGSVEYHSQWLEPGFSITGRITMINEVALNDENKEAQYLDFHWGFHFDWTYETADKNFFIEFANFNDAKGEVLTQSQYKRIAEDIKQFLELQEDDFYETGYNEKGLFEFFTARLDFKYLDKFSKFYELCRITLIEDFLSKMKDRNALTE